VSTIKSSREIDGIFRKSTRIAHPLLIARIGNAVVRNRAKRVMRAAVRRAGGPWAGYDVLLIANASTGSADAAGIDAAIRRFLSRAGIQVRP
jgi:RNase P protein component